ncbi:hypothetical protein ACFO5Q_00695 [Kordiimonas lipolytica]|uniref:Uncharacterized protein n=1 Tax=Kordiimonas lipolytica TaxID=1662421 RepID=A0ABV8U6N3_9PROT|nr:hypothetical protein [Kordiimonas lipolytica]
MTAPFEIANRFDVLTWRQPHALSNVLSHFSTSQSQPSRVSTVAHKDGTLSVIIVVKELAEAEARAIQSDLKEDKQVLRAMLEHFVG